MIESQEGALQFKETIEAVERLIDQGSEASLTYAALECRLALERICYERLRIAHKYISHADLKRWQPKDVVQQLIQDVDPHVASTFTLSISRQPVVEGREPQSAADYEKIDFVEVGTQIGFDPSKLGRLWNALANVALHVTLPEDSDARVSQYGEREKILVKVQEALNEIKRIAAGTLLSAGTGEEISFECWCGSKNTRRLPTLSAGQLISCIDARCDETYTYEQGTKSFLRQVVDLKCRCGATNAVAKRTLRKMRVDQPKPFKCVCGEEIIVSWQPMQAQHPS